MDGKDRWIDEVLRDQGAYRLTLHSDGVSKSLCNDNDMEDALITALDAGLSAEEIADIQLGSIS